MYLFDHRLFRWVACTPGSGAIKLAPPPGAIHRVTPSGCTKPRDKKQETRARADYDYEYDDEHEEELEYEHEYEHEHEGDRDEGRIFALGQRAR
jgi:hypothetical protein